MIDDLAVRVSSTRRVRSLAWVLAPVVKTGSVVWTLAVIEAFPTSASHQGISPVTATTTQISDASLRAEEGLTHGQVQIGRGLPELSLPGLHSAS